MHNAADTPDDQLPDFDRLMRMAQDDPDGLEALRDRLAAQVIDNAAPAHRQRLRGLQFTIDMERRRAANPMAACIRISDMMNASLADLQAALNQGDLPAGSGGDRPASVVPFGR